MELSCNKELSSSARSILQNRLHSLLNSIGSYFDNINQENLHHVRIALRRVRYSMELFIKCFNRKNYLSFYKVVSSLQDLSGSIRDLDVLKQNLQRFRRRGIPITEGISLDKIDKKKNQFQSTFKIELMKFIYGKELKQFKEIIYSHF